MSGPFRPDELRGTPGSSSPSEDALAFAAARELEAALPDEPLAISSGFADRVMAAVAAEPSPSTAGFLAPLSRQPGLAGVRASLAAAWVVLTGGCARRGSRGLAVAYLAAVVLITGSILGLGAYGAAGALGLLDSSPRPSPTVPVPSDAPTSPTPSPTTIPTPSVAPTPSPVASPSATPGASSGASEEPSESPETSPEASDDDGGGGNSGPGSGGSPRPSESADASESPD